LKPKVLIFTTSLSKGGAERNASILSQFLDAEVFIAVFKNSPITYPYGGTLVKLDITKTKGYFSKLFYFIKRIMDLKKLKRDLEIDICISLLDQPNLMNILSKNNEKTIISVRNFKSIKDKEIKGLIPIVKNWLLRLFYNRADVVVAVSNAMLKDLEINYKIKRDKLTVIPNGCDLDYIQSRKKYINHDYDEIFQNPTIITIGKLEHQKAQWHLIRSFILVKKEIPDAKLIIIGEGSLSEYLIELIDDYDAQYSFNNKPSQLKKDIILLDFQKNPFSYLNRAKVFALPSLYEGFPNVMIEAMACGLPIISSDCSSGPREILSSELNINSKITYPYEGDHGILLPVFDGNYYSAKDNHSKEEIIWAKALVKMLINYKLNERYKQESTIRVSDFSIDNTIHLWDNLLTT